MPNVGDRVRINIEGPNELAGTTNVSGTTPVGVGTSIIVSGKIIQDLGDKWIVLLDDDKLFGNKRMVIEKSTFRR